MKLRRRRLSTQNFLFLIGQDHTLQDVEAMIIADQIQEVVMQDLEQEIIQFNQMFWEFLV